MCRIEIKHYIHPSSNRRETVEIPFYCHQSDGKRFCNNTERVDMGNIIIRSTSTSGAPSPVSLVRDVWPSPPSSNQPGTPVSATSANYEIRAPPSRGGSQPGKRKDKSDRVSIEIGRRDSKSGGKYFKRRSNPGHSSSEEDIVRLDGTSLPSTGRVGPGLFGTVPTPPPPPPIAGGVPFQMPDSPTSYHRRRPQSVEVHNDTLDPIIAIEGDTDNEYQLREAARERFRREERERRRKADDERRKREKEEREEEAARLENARIDAREGIRQEARARREREEREKKEKEEREQRRKLEEVERELAELRRQQREAERENERREKEAAEARAREAEQFAIEMEIDRLNRQQKHQDERRRSKKIDEERKKREDEYQKWIERQEAEAKAAMERSAELENEIRELRAERERRNTLEQYMRARREYGELEQDLGSNVASIGARPPSRPTSQRGYGYGAGGAFQPGSYGSSASSYNTSPIATRPYSPIASRPYSPTGAVPNPFGFPAPMPLPLPPQPQPPSPSSARHYPSAGFYHPFPALPAAPLYTPPTAGGELVQTRPRNVSDEEWRRERGQQVLATERARQRTKDLEDALRRGAAGGGGGGYQ